MIMNKVLELDKIYVCNPFNEYSFLHNFSVPITFLIFLIFISGGVDV